MMNNETISPLSPFLPFLLSFSFSPSPRLIHLRRISGLGKKKTPKKQNDLTVLRDGDEEAEPQQQRRR
ncbi:uncharacterized [Tachysurus ichikawai]